MAHGRLQVALSGLIVIVVLVACCSGSARRTTDEMGTTDPIFDQGFVVVEVDPVIPECMFKGVCTRSDVGAMIGMNWAAAAKVRLLETINEEGDEAR